MKKLSILLVAVFFLTLAGCASNSGSGQVNVQPTVTTSSQQQSYLTPEKVAEQHYKASLYGETEAFLDCIGVVKDENSLSTFQINPPQSVVENRDSIIFSDFRYEKFGEEDQAIAMTSLREDWLSRNYKFVYSISDVIEIGRVSFTMSYGNESVEQWICVVKTEKGWYTASIDLY